jgi:cbb3-type cytochrome oxidase subunit 3
MIDWLTDNAAMAGLFFFMSAFSAVVFWAFRPAAKAAIEAHKYIPLETSKSAGDDL